MIGPTFAKDVARYVVAGGFADPAEITLGQTVGLVYRNLGLRAILALRIGKWFKARGVPGVAGIMQRLILRRYGLDVVIGAPIGGGLYIPHPSGTTLAPKAMGEGCSVIASVTVGMRNEHAFPTIGDRVFLGAGSRVLGDVELGDDAKVGANAVVLDDVPAGCSVGGIPARQLGSGATSDRHAETSEDQHDRV